MAVGSERTNVRSITQASLIRTFTDHSRKSLVNVTSYELVAICFPRKPASLSIDESRRSKDA
jgi:hypothetical protein